MISNPLTSHKQNIAAGYRSEISHWQWHASVCLFRFIWSQHVFMCSNSSNHVHIISIIPWHWKLLQKQETAVFWSNTQILWCYLGADRPACPGRVWLGFWVFPAGGFFACDCLLFPLSDLPLKSLFTSSALKGIFVVDWFPSVALDFSLGCWSILAISIANLVGA